MPATAELQWKSDGSAAEATVSKLERGYSKLASQMERLQAASTRAAGASKKGMDDSAAAAGNFSGALEGVVKGAVAALSVGQALREEYDNLIARQKEAAGAQTKAAVTQRDVRKAFQADATMRADQLEPRLEALRQKHNVSTEFVSGVAAEAFSAKGAASNAQAMSAMDAAIRVSPTNQDEATVLASRYLDLMNAGGIQDARQVGGFIGQLQANSRVKNMGMLGSNLVPAINSLMQQGNTMEQAGELTAALNNMLSDAEGAITKTAIINLGKRLKSFVPEAKNEDAFGTFTLSKESIAGYDAVRGMGTQAQIAALQADPQLRRAFLAKNSFEAEAQAPIESLLSGTANAREQLEAVRGGIAPVNAKLAEEFEKQIRFYNSGTFQPISDAERESEANRETANLRDRRRGYEGRVREILEQTLTHTDDPGLDSFDDRARLMAHDARVALGTTDAARSAIGEIRQGMLGLSPEDQRYAEAQIRVLERLLEAVERQTTTIERQGSREPRAANPPIAALGD